MSVDLSYFYIQFCTVLPSHVRGHEYYRLHKSHCKYDVHRMFFLLRIALVLAVFTLHMRNK